MLNEIATWWAQQMLGLLPERARHWGDRRGNALFVEPGPAVGAAAPATVALIRRRHRRDRPLGRFPLDESALPALRRAVGARRGSARVVLRLPPGILLEHRYAIPLPAEREAGQMLRYEMDRVTPFSADEVFWNWAIERRDRPRGRLHVRVSLVPRAGLDPLIEHLGRAGIAPTVLEAPAADGGARVIALDPISTARQRTQRRWTEAAAIACVVLAVTASVLPFTLQSMAVARTERQIAALRPRVSEVEALRRRMAGQAAGSNAVAAERARIGDALGALAAVTGILPDDTFLTEFSLAQRKIALTGRSAEAARLISAMSADPAIRDPSFSAPVVRAGTGRADLFSIRAELAP